MAVEQNSGVSWLSSLSRFGIRPGLERTKRVLGYYGDPQHDLRFYHIAGTNGKGSVCANLYALLRTRLRVGMFTSPSFDGYQGRFIVDEEVILQAQFERLALSVRDAVAAVTPDDPLTEFEALTVMAILYFKEEDVEAVVWETGLGGRFDSTNVVTPVVTAITNVGLDHVQILGPTIRHIARDKSGIIKEGKSVITAASGPALDVIREVANRQSAKLYVIGKDFGYSRRRAKDNRLSMDYRGITKDWFDVPVALAGVHQSQNTAVALAMFEVAVQQGFVSLPSLAEIRRTMSQVTWPGRFEVSHLSDSTVILDGAHNPDGARMLALSLGELHSVDVSDSRIHHHTGAFTMVVGILGDKDVKGILRPLLPLAQNIIAVAPSNSRALSAPELAEVIREMAPRLDVRVEASVDDGLRQAIASSETHFICCFGSLYTVDEARKAMETMQHSGKQGR